MSTREEARGRIRRDSLQSAEGIESENVRAGLNSEGLQILADQGGGRNMIFDEGYFTSAATEGFDPNRARAGECVDEVRIGNAVGQDIEKSFAQSGRSLGRRASPLRLLSGRLRNLPAITRMVVSMQPQPM